MQARRGGVSVELDEFMSGRTRHNANRTPCTDRFRGSIPFARLDGQSAQNFRGDAADRVLKLGRDIVDEHSERVDHVGAETGVGQIERSDEEGEKLNENIVPVSAQSMTHCAVLGRLTLGSSVNVSCFGMCRSKEESATR